MTKILALDISTSCTGWSYWDDKKLIEAGAIETPTDKYDSIFLKMDHVKEELYKKMNPLGVDLIVAESAFKKFASGQSSADVIAKLVGFNFCLTYTLTRLLKSKELFIDVKSARKTVGIKVPKGDNAKLIVHKYASAKYPNLDWPVKKTGTPKDWTIDMADALVIGEYALQFNQ